MRDNKYLFTSESVSEGHPDKVCDRISDMVVDTYLGMEPQARVACETLTTTNKVVLAGETRGPDINKDELIEIYKKQLPKEEVSYPLVNDKYKYFTKINNNEELKRIYRSSNKKEELLFNPNIKLKTQEYYDVKGVYPSNDNTLVLLSEDNNGRRTYTLKFLDPNNKVYENVGMPHVLLEMQGEQFSVCKQIPEIASNGGIKQDPVTGEQLSIEKCGFLEVKEGSGSVSYTHLTLPTKA